MEGGPPGFIPDFTCPALLGIYGSQAWGFRIQGFNLVPPGFPSRFAIRMLCNCAGAPKRSGKPFPQHRMQQRLRALTHAWVWASARSLAATCAISVDFSSSGYLDVSVPRVASRPLCVQGRVSGHGPARVPPFGDPRIEGCVPLPADYRSLPRPSSASCAKASAVRP